MSISRSIGIACLSAMLTVEASSQVDRAQTLPAPQRVYLASRIYSAVEQYFAGWTPELRKQFDEALQSRLKLRNRAGLHVNLGEAHDGVGIEGGTRHHLIDHGEGLIEKRAGFFHDYFAG